MSAPKLTVAISLAVASLCSLIYGSVAAAATPSWMVGGKTLLAGETLSLSTAVHVHEGLLVEAGGLTVACTGTTINSTSPVITGPNTGSAQSIELKECQFVGSTNCRLSSETVDILPVTGEATLDGALAVKEVIKPKTKNTFATIAITGEGCALVGVQPITGKSTFLAPTGQDESTLQLWRSSPTAGELKVGSDEATLKIATLVGLAAGESWSFL